MPAIQAAPPKLSSGLGHGNSRAVVVAGMLVGGMVGSMVGGSAGGKRRKGGRHHGQKDKKKRKPGRAASAAKVETALGKNVAKTVPGEGRSHSAGTSSERSAGAFPRVRHRSRVQL